MKIRHKVSGRLPERVDSEWAERVEREAEQTTAAREKAFRKAEARMERALLKAREAEEKAKDGARTRRIRRLWDEVEARRAELKALQSVTRASPAGAQHRGKGAHRGVSTGDAL